MPTYWGWVDDKENWSRNHVEDGHRASSLHSEMPWNPKEMEPRQGVQDQACQRAYKRSRIRKLCHHRVMINTFITFKRFVSFNVWAKARLQMLFVGRKRVQITLSKMLMVKKNKES